MSVFTKYIHIPPNYAFKLVSFGLGELGDGLNIFQGVYLVGLGWNEGSVGIALCMMGLTALVVQTWVGDVVDTSTVDRRIFLIAAGLVTALSALIIMFVRAGNTDHVMVYTAKIVEGVASSFIAPTIAALTLASFGPDQYDTVMANNILWGHFGSVFAASLAGYFAFVFYPRVKYSFLVLGSSALLATLLVPLLPEGDPLVGRGFCCAWSPVDDDDDFDMDASTILHPPRVRTGTIGTVGIDRAETKQLPKAASYWETFSDRNTLVLCITGFFFHFANTNVLLVLGELMGGEMVEGEFNKSTLPLIAIAILLQQSTMAFATWVGANLTHRGFGRKPMYLIGLASLPIRCALLIRWRNLGPVWLLSTQVLDGIGAGLCDLVHSYLVADITFGTGRFNLVMGMTASYFGLGMTLSNYLGQLVVEKVGHVASLAGSFFLSIVAFTFFAVFMSETLGQRGKARSEIEADSPPDGDFKVYEIL